MGSNRSQECGLDVAQPALLVPPLPAGLISSSGPDTVVGLVRGFVVKLPAVQVECDLTLEKMSINQMRLERVFYLPPFTPLPLSAVVAFCSPFNKIVFFTTFVINFSPQTRVQCIKDRY